MDSALDNRRRGNIVRPAGRISPEEHQLFKYLLCRGVYADLVDVQYRILLRIDTYTMHDPLAVLITFFGGFKCYEGRMFRFVEKEIDQIRKYSVADRWRLFGTIVIQRFQGNLIKA